MVEQVTADILDWPIPDDATTIFMFNPFFGETFYAILEKVFDSYDRNPRDLHVLYAFPLTTRAGRHRPRGGRERAAQHLAAATAMVGTERRDRHLPRDQGWRANHRQRTALSGPGVARPRRCTGGAPPTDIRSATPLARTTAAVPFPCRQSRVRCYLQCPVTVATRWTSAVRWNACQQSTSSSRCTTSLM